MKVGLRRSSEPRRSANASLVIRDAFCISDHQEIEELLPREKKDWLFFPYGPGKCKEQGTPCEDEFKTR
jgi:hypothetical protein